MFLTSVNELIQHYFRSSLTLHNKLLVIKLILTYFSNFFCHDFFISDGGTVKNNLGTLSSVYMLNALSYMQAQIVLTLTVAVLIVIDMVLILLE